MKRVMNTASDTVSLKVIARIRTDFPEKFGVPRQSGLIENRARIIFEPEYRDPEALRGIEQYSHLWLIWGFSEHFEEGWHPTVRPPKLGGNTRIGVFATRSPFRPNPIGLSSVRLLGQDHSADDGTVLLVSGADMVDQTPIFDIKPYLSYTDAHPDALSGFAGTVSDHRLAVLIPDNIRKQIGSEEAVSDLTDVLSLDIRPGYQDDPQRIYGLSWRSLNVAFRVENNIIHVLDIKQNISETVH